MKNGGSFHSYVSLPEGMFNIFNMLSLSMHHSRIEGGFSEGAEVRRASLLLGSRSQASTQFSKRWGNTWRSARRWRSLGALGPGRPPGFHRLLLISTGKPWRCFENAQDMFGQDFKERHHIINDIMSTPD